MTPEPGKFYLATDEDGDNPTPFIVTNEPSGGDLAPGLTAWGFSVYKNAPDYRTLGIRFADWLVRNPGLVVTGDYDRRLSGPPKPKRPRKPAPVSLAKARLQPVPEVVALLADLTRRAKAGEIRGIAVGIASDRQSDASCFVIGDGSIASLYLGIERCKLRLLHVGLE